MRPSFFNRRVVWKRSFWIFLECSYLRWCEFACTNVCCVNIRICNSRY
uniref:Uncharacterized protein n=1 Tax=Cryptosporidium parvum TaxID=5807 RepID=F0X6F1_CRYPV